MVINGVNMYYEQGGQGETRLVLIHGNVASARWWDLVWPLLTAKAEVLRVDLRGFCEAGAPREGNLIELYGASIRGLLHELGWEKAVFVGHSLGGAVTMEIAVSEPELAAGIVLINSAPAEGFYTPEERKPLMEKLTQDRNLMKMALTSMVPTAATGEFFERLVDDAMNASPTYIPNADALGEVDYRERLSRLEIPALIVYGNQDILITLDMMERTRDAIREAELLIYEGIGHSPNVEAPERLVEDVLKFAARVRV
jgi:3-oxoadipate enol-lactonase